MKSHISKVRIAALAVGIAILMSSCGIQNQADNSASAPAVGKTKNAALTSEWCYTTGVSVDIDQALDFGIGRLVSIRWLADDTRSHGREMNRYFWESDELISDVYGPSIVPCSTLVSIDVAAAAGATNANDLSPEFIENSTANQCITVEERKKTLRGYDEQIMAHSLDEDKTIYEQMKTGRWVTTLQRPCNETQEENQFSGLACVSVSHKAFEVAFYNEQYELHKDEVGTPYLDMIIIGKEKANALVTC